MTCREFKHYAASLSLLELAKMEDRQLTDHTQSCAGCGSWLQKQRMLNASMHALRARTASLEAGPDVERTLLSVFRQGIPVAGTAPPTKGVAVIGMKGPLETWRPHSKTAFRSTPFAIRLSRIFEIGAYAAVAAAIIVGLFLSVHLLRRGGGKPMQGKSVPERTAPVLQPSASSVNVAHPELASGNSARVLSRRHEPGIMHRPASAPVKSSPPQVATNSNLSAAVAEDWPSDDDVDYTVLMLCDPLSCASDTQVVRMQLPSQPSAAAQGAPPQMADMVVGYDGVVRAVRFVN
jgi:hypothetical protein